MELKKIREFIDFMNENQLSELEIEEEGKRVRLKKNISEQPVAYVPAAAPVKAGKEKIEEKKDTSIEIKSPMVGTFYRASSPGAKPYVDIGDTIKPGDVVCIIEAMKLMNEIKSEIAGKVVQISVNNGEPVEFGQALFAIEPYSK